jgi:HEPN domain-containing protein
LADRDLTAFNVLRNAGEVHPAITGFHAQQAVEKALKAVLFAHQIEFARTHNLVRLAALLKQRDIAVPVADEQLGNLNPFAVTLRYDDLEVSDLTLEETVVVVETVRRWAGEQVVEVINDNE